MDNWSRRRFLVTGAAAAAAARTGSWLLQRPAPRSILILGGTGFIGPHLVWLAVDRGHRVTTFTRGRREADLPDQVERLTGDRNGQLDALRDRRWDAVVDDSATNPDWVRLSAALLAPATGRYLFTSSTGVYYPYLRKGLAEADAVHTELRDPKDGSESFGTRKAQCEAIVGDTFGDRGTVVRPTYIVGPGDYTDRFTYWPVRLRRGGEILAPGGRRDPVQFIDVRDLAAFMLGLVEGDAGGIYNAVGPREPTGIERFLTEAAAALDVRPNLVWVEDHQFLATNGIEGMVPWILPAGNDLGHTSIVSTRSWDRGLAPRPVAETVRDTAAWFDGLPADRRAAARWVITAEREAELLAAWRARG